MDLSRQAQIHALEMLGDLALQNSYFHGDLWAELPAELRRAYPDALQEVAQQLIDRAARLKGQP